MFEIQNPQVVTISKNICVLDNLTTFDATIRNTLKTMIGFHDYII